MQVISQRGKAPLNVSINKVGRNLKLGENGIWYSETQTDLSYPEEGNENCLALESDSFWFEHRNRCIVSLLRRFPPPGMIFDVGGGNGYVAQGMQQAGFGVALVEPGPQGAKNARLRGVEHVICSTLQNAGFLPSSLPAVGLFDVLEHIADDRLFLDEIRNLLVPGGRLYLTVPAYQLLWSADDRYSGHYRRYTLAGLRKALRSAGLKPLYQSYIFWMLPLPILLLRAVPTWLGLRKENAWSQYQQEHSSRSGIVERLLSLELGIMARGGMIPLGGSCLVAAEKEGSG